MNRTSLPGLRIQEPTTPTAIVAMIASRNGIKSNYEISIVRIHFPHFFFSLLLAIGDQCKALGTYSIQYLALKITASCLSVIIHHFKAIGNIPHSSCIITFTFKLYLFALVMHIISCLSLL